MEKEETEKDVERKSKRGQEGGWEKKGQEKKERKDIVIFDLFERLWFIPMNSCWTKKSKHNIILHLTVLEFLIKMQYYN